MKGEVLNESLATFARDLTLNYLILLDHNGKVTSFGKFFSILLWFLGLSRFIWQKTAQNFIVLLKNLESMPIIVGTNGHTHAKFAAYLIIGEQLGRKIKSYHNAKSQLLAQELCYYCLALGYRLESTSSSNQQPLTSLQNELSRLALTWKHSNSLLRNKELSVSDEAKLSQLVSYRRLAILLCHSPFLRDRFFTYALRDRGNIDLFAQFPGLLQKLEQSNMLGRLGRLGADQLLKIQWLSTAPETYQKIVTLLFEGQRHNILDENSTITFKGNYTLTIGQIFAIFQKKNFEVGNLEMMAEGIVNWNVHKLGRWNASKGLYEQIPIQRRYWWKLLPLFETISKQEAKSRYGTKLNGHNWNASATATRGSATLDYEQSHAYLELAIPLSHGRYAIYDFGKFAITFPKNFFESLAMFCHNVLATVAYPDENCFYTHRQHVQHSFTLTRHQGEQLLELIRSDLIKARAGNFVYQIESENCAKWLHEKLEAVLGKLYNLFKVSLLKSEPFGAVAWIFKAIRLMPHTLQVSILMFFHLLLGASHQTWIFEKGEYVCKSLRQHEFWQNGIVYLPAYLHYQFEKGAIGLITMLNKIGERSHRFVGRFCQCFYDRMVLNLFSLKISTATLLLYYDTPQATAQRGKEKFRGLLSTRLNH